MILPSLRDLLDGTAKHPAFQSALERLRKRAPASVHLAGLNPTAKALYIVLLYKFTDRPLVVLVESGSAADSLAEAMGAFFDLLEVSDHRRAPLVLPAHDVTPYDGLSPHAEIHEKRGIGLWRMAEGSASIVVAPIQSMLLKVASIEVLRNLAWKIEVGDEFYMEDLEQGLLSVGYERHEPVEMVGQFSVRGGIIDVFSPESALPVRIEMLGDQVESMRSFDPETQKSVQSSDQAVLLPLTEYQVAGPAGSSNEKPGSRHGERQIPDPARILQPGWEYQDEAAAARRSCVLDLLEDPILVWSEPTAVASEAEKLWTGLETAYGGPESGISPPDKFYLSWKQLAESASSCQQVHLEELGLEGGPEPLHISSQPTPRFQGNIPQFIRELEGQVKSGARALVAAHSLGDVERLADIFADYGVSYQLGLKDPSKAGSPYLEEKAYLAGPVSSVILVEAPIRLGTVLPDSRVLIYGSEDLFAASEMVARPRKQRSAASTFLSGLQDLREGDLIVHTEHGIGRYLGVREMRHGARLEDFMLIEYAERARLYVPLSRLDLVQKYHGAGGPPPALDRMGGQTWTRTKSKVKARLLDMAEELTKLYAVRKQAVGFSFSGDSNWQREFEEAFEYIETPDQIKALSDIKSDMESPRPMDRLVCGDVGFGKTEVAMRAAFKALGDGKQVAVLAPTTVLAFQHYETFRQRFAPFPVEIEMLTRFRTARGQKQILEKLAAGTMDIVIGTHRLLSKDVHFKDLGLLVVDEEQRFGVRHKERLKQITKEVDVLTLTATPIPRTLHMSLIGLRDVSAIQTPPRDRLSIHTVVAPASDQLIRTAIQQEVGRGGQVYFVHNRVESIWRVASRIQRLAPGVRIGVGHGQMSERELETVMLKFMRREYDLLVATTIVENGLDIPLANTILINRADQHGLAELYQLRGRVGRSNRRAYAYLLVEEGQELSAAARKRLAALKEFSELGSGFKIAALDLELRGAGNLLGAEQHGHIGAVGFETYCRLLDETVRNLQGEEVEETRPVTLRLQLDIHIPPDYIADETQRLQAYKWVAEIQTEEEADRRAAELLDRYGPLPPAVRNLIGYALLKSIAERMRVESIERRRKRYIIRFREDSKVDAERLLAFVTSTRGITFSPQGELEWEIQDDAGPDLDAIRGLLDRLSSEQESAVEHTQKA